MTDPEAFPGFLPPEDDTPGLLWDPFAGAEPVYCPCCGAEFPCPPQQGDPCPLCGWETDAQTTDGLCLEEARMNFRAFGVCAPWQLSGEQP